MDINEEKLKIAIKALEDVSGWVFGWDGDCGVTRCADEALSAIEAIAPPVAAGSVDTPEFCALLKFYGLMYPQGDMARTEQAKAAIIGSIVAWGAQQRAGGRVEGMLEFKSRINEYAQRAEKAEAALATELVRVQDYYTRWRCERENPTNTHRLDTWQAACGKARAERDKAEARVAELEAQLAAAKPYDLKA